MAGGIDWFRWHHGSVTDPKFQLVARRSGASLPDVLAVWAYLLERASASQDRGSFGEVDHEAVDCMFGFPTTESRTADVMAAMEERRLISGDRIVQWEKRQPRRERDDDGAAERKRAERARRGLPAPGGDAGGQGSDGGMGGSVTPPVAIGCQCAPAPAEPAPVTPNEDASAHVTPCHATSRQKQPRGEERRNTNTPPTPPPLAGGAFAAWWAQWPEGPRKVDQVGCERHWRRQRLDEVADAVLAGLQAALASEAWRKDGGAFVPAPRTWLKQRRWLAPTEAQAQAVRAAATWFESRSGIEAKGEALGIGRWDEESFSLGRGEAFPAYRARVFVAAGHRPGSA